MTKLIATLALSTVLASGALAQGTNDATSGQATGATTTGSVGVTTQQQERVRTFWRTTRPEAQSMPANTSVATGDSIPPSLELRTFPNDLGMTNYRYVVVGENLYLVDPRTRRVVHIIQ